MLWRTLLCCLVLAGAVSVEAWKQFVQYQYAVDVRTLTSLRDVAEVYTGSLMKLKLDITTMSETEFTGKITSAKDGSLDPTHMEGGWAYQALPKNLRWQPIPVSNRPFHVLLNENGTVKDMFFDKSVKLWERELIAGLVYQLVIAPFANPSKKEPFLNPPTGKDSKFSSFHTTEKSLLGECDVMYVINPLTAAEVLHQHYSIAGELENHLVVSKSWNLTHCKRMKKFTMGLSDPLNVNAGGNAQLPISRSMQSRAVINGDLKDFTIALVETNSTFFVPPQLYNKQKSMVATNFKASLLSKTPISRPLPRPQNPEGTENSVRQQRQAFQNYAPFIEDNSFVSAIYWGAEENDYMKDQNNDWSSYVPPLPYHNGNNDERIGDGLGRNISDVMVQLVSLISTNLHGSGSVTAPWILSNVIVCTKHMRTMTLEEIVTTHNILVEKENSNPAEFKWAGKVFRNIAALTGTPYSLQAIFLWLKKEVISIKEFTQHISVQREVAFIPNYYYLETLRQIAMEVDKTQHPDQQALWNLRATVGLTFTDILRTAGRKQTQLISSVVDYYITRMEEAIKAKNNEELQLIIRLLGNVASKGILKTFYEIINGERGMTEHLRLHTLVCLDWLTAIHPTVMTKFWFSVFANTSLPHRLRCQAVPNIMRSHPPAWMLQQMAQATHNESNPHVISQVASAIRTAAQLRGPFNENLARNARAAKSLLKPVVYDASYSGVLFDSYKIDGMDLAYTQLLNYIGSQDSLLPSSFQYFLNKNYNGYRPLDFQISGMVTSANDTLEAIVNWLFKPQQTFVSTNIGTTPFPGIHVQRRPKLEGNLNIPGYGFWPFDGESLQKKFSEIIVNADSGTLPVETMKMSNAREVIFAVPSGIGHTFVYTHTSVQLTNIKGNIRLQKHFDITKSSASKSRSLSVNLQADCNIDITLAMREESKVGFVTPWNSLDYINGVNINTQVRAPINASVGVEFNNEWNDLKLHAELGLPKTESVNILHRSSEPYVTKIWLLGDTTTTGNPNTTLLHTKSAVTSSSWWGKGSTGIATRLDYYSEIDASYENIVGEKPQFLQEKSWWSAAYRWLYQQWKGYNTFSIIHFPFASRDIHISSLNVTYDPWESTANTARFTWRIGGFPTPAGIIGALKAQKHRYHPKSLGVPLAVEVLPQQQLSAGPSQRQVLWNATFEGKTVAVFGLHGALRSNVMNQSFTSTVQLWSKPAAKQQFNAALELSLQVPQVSLWNFKQALSASPNSTMELLLTAQRPSWAKPAVVMLTGKLGRTPQRQEYISESPVAKACLKEMQSGLNILPACQNATSWANSLDAYELSIRYKHIPVELKRVAFAAYSIVRQAAYSELQEEVFRVNPSTHTISVGLYINNQDTACNFSIQSSLVNANITNFPLPSWTKPVVLNAGTSLADRIGQHIYPLSYAPSFVVDHGHVVTFDGKRYPWKASTCWYIALAYTPKWQADAPIDQKQVYSFKDHRHLVLIRQTEDGLLESKIIYNNLVVELRGQPHTPTPTIYINGEVLDLEPQQVISIGGAADLHITVDGAVSLSCYGSHNTNLYQDSNRMQIMSDEWMKESVTGMVGNFNDDDQDDFLSPKGCVRRDYEAFEAEWADCELPSKESKCVFIQNNTVNPTQPVLNSQRISSASVQSPPNIFDDFDSSSESSESQEQSRENVRSFINAGGRPLRV